MANGQDTFRNVVLPLASILETIATARASKGKFVGTSAQQAIKGIDEQRRVEEDQRQKAIDRAAGAEDRALTRKIKTAQLGEIERGIEQEQSAIDELLGSHVEGKTTLSPLELTAIKGGRIQDVLKGRQTEITKPRFTERQEGIIAGLSEEQKQKFLLTGKLPKTPEEREQEFADLERKSQIQAKANADALFNRLRIEKDLKPRSGDAGKLLGITKTLPDEIRELQQMFRNDFNGTVRGILFGTDPDLARRAANIADKVGRIRSGGAINTGEEKRFLGNLARGMDLLVGSSDKTNKFLDGIIKESEITRRAVEGEKDPVLNEQPAIKEIQNKALQNLIKNAQAGQKDAQEILNNAGVEWQKK